MPSRCRTMTGQKARSSLEDKGDGTLEPQGHQLEKQKFKISINERMTKIYFFI